MKTKTSLRGELDRNENSFLVKRQGVLYILNKIKPRFKVKQKNNSKKRKIKLR